MAHIDLLPDDFHTEHFSNEELETLVKNHGQLLVSPTDIAPIVEKMYGFNSLHEVLDDQMANKMFYYDRGRFVATIWKMVCKKKGIKS
jgi:hypothetical protein